MSECEGLCNRKRSTRQGEARRKESSTQEVTREDVYVLGIGQPEPSHTADPHVDSMLLRLGTLNMRV